MIYLAGYIPAGPCIKLGTMGSLALAMQQALVTDASLRQSLQRCDALAVQALCNEQGTSFRFQPARVNGRVYS